MDPVAGEFPGRPTSDRSIISVTAGQPWEALRPTLPARSGARSARRPRGRARHRTANPANCVLQDEFPDLFFRATKCEHLVSLKEKFKRVCQRLGVAKRHLHYTEELSSTPTRPSLDARLDIVKTAVPSSPRQPPGRPSPSGGRPATDITHLARTSRASDFQLVPLLGRCVPHRASLHNALPQWLLAGGRRAFASQDLAENNRGARVLVVCAEINVLLGLFGDGAGAVIVGADPTTTNTAAERPLFEIVSTAQAIIPESEDFITMHLTKSGYGGNISVRQIPVLIGDNIERCLLDALEPLGDIIGGAAEWNDLFWDVEAVLQLKHEKLAASRRVLSEYGNMMGVTRRRMEKGEEVGAPEWGVMTMVLCRCVAQGTSAMAEEKLTGALRMLLRRPVCVRF
ncbi:hypothetical protein HU200_034235 [Digitaria exilis]|uniref:Uncharacterized protein n=1 Tax=Digitaria exilis TaxID=1010633 RepID=A0A835BIH7_9POAL|nr:hypothetical protein HU200_034235 [Digitaria exilis]